MRPSPAKAICESAASSDSIVMTISPRHAPAMSVASWAPTKLAELDEDTMQRIADLYAHDPMLGQRLSAAQSADSMAGDEAQGMQAGAGANRYEEVIRATAAEKRSGVRLWAVDSATE